MKAFKWCAYPFNKMFICLTVLLKHVSSLLICSKKLHPFNAVAKCLKGLFIHFKKTYSFLSQAVQSINIMFARYSPVLEM